MTHVIRHSALLTYALRSHNSTGFLAFTLRLRDVPQNIVVFDIPRTKLIGLIVPRLGQRSRAEGLESEGEHLRGGRVMEPRLVVFHDVQVRHAYREVDGGRIVRDVEEDEGLPRTYAAVLDALADHVGEQLGDNGGGECPGCGGKALAVLVDHVAFRPDFWLEAGDDLIDAQLVWRLILNSECGDFLAVRSPVHIELVCPITLSPRLATGLGSRWGPGSCRWV